MRCVLLWTGREGGRVGDRRRRYAEGVVVGAGGAGLGVEVGAWPNDLGEHEACPPAERHPPSDGVDLRYAG
jgi:hypothetical protein